MAAEKTPSHFNYETEWEKREESIGKIRDDSKRAREWLKYNVEKRKEYENALLLSFKYADRLPTGEKWPLGIDHKWKSGERPEDRGEWQLIKDGKVIGRIYADYETFTQGEPGGPKAEGSRHSFHYEFTMPGWGEFKGQDYNINDFERQFRDAMTSLVLRDYMENSKDPELEQFKKKFNFTKSGDDYAFFDFHSSLSFTIKKDGRNGITMTIGEANMTFENLDGLKAQLKLLMRAYGPSEKRA